jgi:hypothetical protein
MEELIWPGEKPQAGQGIVLVSENNPLHLHESKHNSTPLFNDPQTLSAQSMGAPPASVLRWSTRIVVARSSRSAAPAVLSSLLALLFLFVELVLLLVVEQGANLSIRVFPHLHHFRPHGLPVAA